MSIFFCTFVADFVYECTKVNVRRNPTPGEFYDRPLDARSSGALHPPREGGR